MTKPRLELPNGNGFSPIKHKGSCYLFMEPLRRNGGFLFLMFAAIVLVPGVLGFFEPQSSDLNYLGVFVATFILIILPLTMAGLYGVLSQPCVAILDTRIEELQIPSWFTGRVKSRRPTKALYLIVNVIPAGEDSTECGVAIVAADSVKDPTFEVSLWYQVTGGEEYIDTCLVRLREQVQWKGVVHY